MQRVAILGGGPAGLAAATALHAGGFDFRMFDEGAPLSHREHDRAEQLGIGIGGAGLFSDGKFSFYPSGTALYTLADKARLQQSYEAIIAFLHGSGIEAPPFPVLGNAGMSGGAFQTKDYFSSYGTLAQRIDLTDAMCAGYDDNILPFCSVRKVERHEHGYALTYRKGLNGPEVTEIFSDMVVASGRFAGETLERIFGDILPYDEHRYELGVRLEHPDNIGFLKHSKNPDVKFIFHESEVEVRTFCTCRNGEAWMIPYADSSALSGRSDGPPSAYCNFGLLPRFTGEKRAMGREIWQHFRENFPTIDTALWQPLPEFVDGIGAGSEPATLDERPWHPRDNFVRGDIAAALHPDLRAILQGSMRAIVERYPDMYSPETICLFPSVEGVGHFPATDDNLRVPEENIWCCGDVVGQFRGLIPALVSGHYVGTAVAEKLRARPSLSLSFPQDEVL